MIVTISAKKISINDEFQSHAEKKLRKLDRFFGEESQGKIVMSAEKDKVTLELTVVHDNLIFRAKHISADKNAALDGAAESIVRQIRKNKTKVEKRLHASAFKEPFEDEIPEHDGKVIRRKEFILRPMSPDEAALQMSILGHNFFMFKNAENGETCVIYRREDGQFALLVPVKD